jgi:hypothetical protein
VEGQAEQKDWKMKLHFQLQVIWNQTVFCLTVQQEEQQKPLM